MAEAFRAFLTCRYLRGLGSSMGGGSKIVQEYFSFFPLSSPSLKINTSIWPRRHFWVPYLCKNKSQISYKNTYSCVFALYIAFKLLDSTNSCPIHFQFTSIWGSEDYRDYDGIYFFPECRIFLSKNYAITFLPVFALYVKAKLIPEWKVDTRVTCLLNSV